MTPNKASRAGAIVMVLAAASLVLVPASSVLADSERGQLRIGISASQPDTIALYWSGKIAAPMARQIEDAFEQRRDQATRVVLTLASGGGSVAEGERVIAVLRRIRQTHRLQTVVGHGRTCGSMCVFIFLQGEQRTAALSSTWLFHEVSKTDRATNRTISLDRARWEHLVDTYFGPAGVSPEWTARMKPLTVRSDYWQTGADLVNDSSGIIHEALGNQKPRMVAEDERPAPRFARSREPDRRRPSSGREGAPAPAHAAEPASKAESSGKECRVYVGSLGLVVATPCPTTSSRR